MEKQIFPKEFINSGLEHYTFKLNKATSLIYLVVILLITAIVVSLPFIFVDVTTKTKGVITTKSKNKQLFAPIGAQVVRSNISENQTVSPGDTLLVLDDRSLKKEVQLFLNRLHVIEIHTSDLAKLISIGKPEENPELKSLEHRLVFKEFQNNLSGLEQEIDNLQQNYSRQKTLFAQDVIARKKFEKDKLLYEKAINSYRLAIDQYRNEWKAKLHSLEKERDRVKSSLYQLNEKKKMYLLISPSGGHLINAVDLDSGQYVPAGLQLCEISADTSFIAACYVPTSEIGLIHVGQRASLAIDAYDFNDWGLIEGNVFEISNDVYLVNDQPYFLVKCDLSKHHLKLKNGFVAELKKGMSLTANFIITERSLLDLLFDKANDWLNPKKI